MLIYKPRSNCRMVLCEVILHKHFQNITQLNLVLTQYSLGDICIFFNSSGKAVFLCLFFSTSDAVVVHWTNPSSSDVSHLEVPLLSWWRSLEIKKVHNWAITTLILKSIYCLTHLSFLGEKSHLFTHLLFMPYYHHDSYSSMSL